MTPASSSKSGTRPAELRYTHIHTHSHTCTPAAQKQTLTTDRYSRPLYCLHCYTWTHKANKNTCHQTNKGAHTHTHTHTHTPGGTQRTTLIATWTWWTRSLHGIPTEISTHSDCVIGLIPKKPDRKIKANWQPSSLYWRGLYKMRPKPTEMFCFAQNGLPIKIHRSTSLFTAYSLSAEWWQISERKRSWVGLWSRPREESKYVALLCHINRGRNEDGKGKRSEVSFFQMIRPPECHGHWFPQ